MSRFTQDQILYVVMSKAGGYDGMSKDKPRAKFASFNKKDAEKQLDHWHELKLVAMSADEMVKLRKQAIEKLDGIERLLVETFHQETILKRAERTEAESRDIVEASEPYHRRTPNPYSGFNNPKVNFNSLASQINAVENGEFEPH